jgi:hypothetical protein
LLERWHIISSFAASNAESHKRVKTGRFWAWAGEGNSSFAQVMRIHGFPQAMRITDFRRRLRAGRFPQASEDSGDCKRVNTWFTLLHIGHSNSLPLARSVQVQVQAPCSISPSNGGAYFTRCSFHQHCTVQESMKPNNFCVHAL